MAVFSTHNPFNAKSGKYYVFKIPVELLSHGYYYNHNTIIADFPKEFDLTQYLKKD